MMKKIKIEDEMRDPCLEDEGVLLDLDELDSEKKKKRVFRKRGNPNSFIVDWQINEDEI